MLLVCDWFLPKSVELENWVPNQEADSRLQDILSPLLLVQCVLGSHVLSKKHTHYSPPYILLPLSHTSNGLVLYHPA